MNTTLKLLFVFAFLIQGCTAGVLTPPSPNATIPVSEIFNISIERAELFKEKIKLSITSVYLSDTEISLTIRIENTSKEDVVIKKPRSTGFGNANSNQLVFNDVYLYLMDAKNDLININPTSQFVLMPEMRDFIQIYSLHTYSDFILLKPGHSYTYKYTDSKPLEWVEKNYSTLTLSPLSLGKYGIYASYENDFMGYYDVPADPGNYTFLIDNNNYIWDLNAWVGRIESTTTFFTIK